MTHYICDDPIDVLVSFSKCQAIPHAFKWKGRKYSLSRTNLVHVAREGRTKIYYFSVSDATNFFKLAFNTENMEWRLMEVFSQ